MNRKELIEKYLEYVRVSGLPAHEVVLGAGGAMLMNRLRETTADLDLGIPQMKYDAYLALGCTEIVTPHPICRYIDLGDKITIHRDNHEIIECINGVWCWSLKEVLNLKLRLNRPKDQDDIKKLIAILGE